MAALARWLRTALRSIPEARDSMEETELRDMNGGPRTNTAGGAA
jgi:hypothetical protein